MVEMKITVEQEEAITHALW